MIPTKTLQEWEQLAEKVLPQGEWKPGRRDLSWFNARGEAQANVYHKTMKDGLHLGQPLPLTIATCHAGETELCDPQATAEFIAASRTAVPALIAEVRRLQADNARMRAALIVAGQALEDASDAICAWDRHSPSDAASANLAYRQICIALAESDK